MKPLYKAGGGLLAAIIGGGLTYQFVGGVEPLYAQLASAVVALLVGLGLYGAVGFLNVLLVSGDGVTEPVGFSDMIRGVFRPISSPWQWLRVGVVFYLGGVTYGVMRNALLDRRSVQMLAVAVGIVLAVAGLYWASRQESR